MVKKDSMKNNREELPIAPLDKCPTGVDGLDEITNGGLPRNRTTLVSGAAGGGKTILGMTFIFEGATKYNEPGVYLSFEEAPGDLVQNFSGFGWDLNKLIRGKKVRIDYIPIEPDEVREAGEYDLEGLFIRLGNAIDSIRAKRVVIDTSEVLFAGLSNLSTVRAELRRLLNWLKSKQVTAIITSEYGEHGFSRHGLDEFVSDCVIFLDHRIVEEMSTRRLRIVKYRGAEHQTNEFPFLIEKTGLSLFPITSLTLRHEASGERISSGIPALDQMLEGKGYFRGTSILITGGAGTGKSTIAAHFAEAACQSGERCLYFAFEESFSQLARNMRSVGIDLSKWMTKGLLEFNAVRPVLYGLELHLAKMLEMIKKRQPSVVIADPISNLSFVGSSHQVKLFWLRFIDFLKSKNIAALFTCLLGVEPENENTDVGISSLMDTWISVRNIESNGERNRLLYVLKSRGMAHSNQVREFRLTNAGVKLAAVYLGPDGVLTGSARRAQEISEQAALRHHECEVERRLRDIKRKREVLEAQITALRAEYEAEKEEIEHLIQEEKLRKQRYTDLRAEMARMRQSNRNHLPGLARKKETEAHK